MIAGTAVRPQEALQSTQVRYYPEVPVDTKEAILDAALNLFNQQGTASVSTNHIAQALNISPGNLYYHYRNKQEIIRALFERMFSAWDTAFQLPEDHPPTFGDLQQLVRLNFEMLWAFRFIYREQVTLLRQDLELRTRYLSVRQRGYAGFHALFASFVQAGVIPAAGEETAVTELADLCWLISEFWLTNLELSGQAVDKDHMEQGVRLLLRVIRSGGQ
jgi:AcrR family transcriptional regulator